MTNNIKELDLSHLVHTNTHYAAQYVPYNSSVEADPIKLFMVVTRFEGVNDHALYYFFIQGEASQDQLLYFFRQNSEILGNDIVVVDTGESFKTDEAVESRALNLKKALPRANVYTPAIVIDFGGVS